ncbi:chemotaxis response regulator protein-glutamate methylesterase [Marivibrio halodurans]|uniref:Protein-glutamate methylesterase/protein-glutamine glutaminase n=1 Tax=Marivibrio halodurans TaxID=2039722 RepID=A0A8J7UZV0_9PROT|nr:chemotaxis response regulator protein-glutamate methylesterase [Marivibrio halodurans]MBP5856066.1 chemotaxis response regulator protein-glutamate methylesterase [Marivibrio halodurans]
MIESAPHSAASGSTTSASRGGGQDSGDPIRVLVVDDALVIRGLIGRMLESAGGIEVVSTAADGRRALDLLDRNVVDVVVLDVEMPVMDGLEALPQIVAKHPRVQVVMASTLTQRNAEISLKAMELGAADYVAKPSSSTELRSADDFKHDLVAKVRALGRVAKRRVGRASTPAPQNQGGAQGGVRAAAQPSTREITLRRFPAAFRPHCIAVGSSTGGPQALFTVLKDVGAVDVPIFITQHMPATFTRILAEHIARATGRDCTEARDGETVRPGHLYVAAGGKHMLIEAKGASKILRLDDGPPENFCKPAVDPMLRSLVKAYGGKVLCAILTGMGADGSKGAEFVADSGGVVLAQDEASSVVWGMPGATAHRGAAMQVLPVGTIGKSLRQVAVGGRP